MFVSPNELRPVLMENFAGYKVMFACAHTFWTCSLLVNEYTHRVSTILTDADDPNLGESVNSGSSKAANGDRFNWNTISAGLYRVTAATENTFYVPALALIGQFP